MQLSTLSDSWAWETLSLASCIICCTALAAILTRSNGNGAPRLPYQISLNTLASILATAAKATLLTAVAAAMGQNKWLKLRSDKAVTRASAIKLFDDASRGPMGALVLLFSGRRGRALAVLGDFVIVASVAFEAFVQQAISYPLQVVYTPSNDVHMPVNRKFYDSWTSNLPWLSYNAGNALLGSALGASAVPEGSPVCSTGNCTWGPHSTLTLCSSCTDVSEFAGKNYNCDPDISEDPDDGSSVLMCNYTLTDGGNTTWASVPNNRPSLQSARLGIEGTQTGWANETFANIQTPLYAFEVIWTHGRYNTPPQGLECAITFCLETYYTGSPISNGVLNSTIKSTEYPTVSYDPQLDIGSYLVAVAGSSNGSQSEEVFKIDALALVLMQRSLDRLLGFSLGTWGPEPSNTIAFNIELQYLVNKTDIAHFPAILDRTVGNFSRYMTNISDAFVSGNLGELKSHVRITWLWLVFPFTLVLFGVVFVVVTIVETRRRSLMVWKESSVALLFHGLETLPGEDGAVLDRASGMEKRADEMKVRLGRAGGGGWEMEVTGRLSGCWKMIKRCRSHGNPMVEPLLEYIDET